MRSISTPFSMSVVVLCTCFVRVAILPTSEAQTLRVADIAGVIHEITDPVIDYTTYPTPGILDFSPRSIDHERNGFRLDQGGLLRWESWEKMFIVRDLKTSQWDTQVKMRGANQAESVGLDLPQDPRNKLLGNLRFGRFEMPLNKISGIEVGSFSPVPAAKEESFSKARIDYVDGSIQTEDKIYYNYSEYYGLTGGQFGTQGTYEPNREVNALMVTVGEAEVLIKFEVLKSVDFRQTKKYWITKEDLHGNPVSYYDVTRKSAWEMSVIDLLRSRYSRKQITSISDADMYEVPFPRHGWSQVPTDSFGTPVFGYGEIVSEVYGKFYFLEGEAVSYKLRLESVELEDLSKIKIDADMFPRSLESYRHLEVIRP